MKINFINLKLNIVVILSKISKPKNVFSMTYLEEIVRKLAEFSFKFGSVYILIKLLAFKVIKRKLALHRRIYRIYFFRRF